MRSVVDFSAGSPTRGCLSPPMGPDGKIIQPRQACAPSLTTLLRERSVADTAQLLRVSERTIWRWLQGAKISAPMNLLIELIAEREGGGK